MMKLSIVIFSVFLSSAAMAQNTEAHAYTLKKDVLWASPKGFDLTMDIYTPDTGKEVYPVLIILHGGGWLINNKSIMDQMSAYVAERSEYVVCNVNYRLLGDLDNTTTMNEQIEDAMGAVLWVKDHIKAYKGDPQQIALTGDSAGGHLTAMVLNAGTNLKSKGFKDEKPGFNPTYLPDGKTAETVAAENGLQIQAAVLSYPATDILASAIGDGTNGLESPSNFFWSMGGAEARGIFGADISYKEHPEYYKLCSPIYTIPNASERKLPPTFCHVGANDNLTTPALVSAYAKALEKAGQPVEYWEYSGRPHAYMDSGKNEFLGISFEKDAVYAIDKVISFLNTVF